MRAVSDNDQSRVLARWIITTGLFSSVFLLLVPVFAAKIPPILDYPNHYARMWLIAGGARIYPISTMYRVVWGNASTNIGIDVVAALLGSIVPSAVISQLVLFFALALPPLGAACLHRHIFGAPHWWQIAMVLLAWNETIVAGFLNFEIALGLALLGAAADAKLVDCGARIAFAARVLIGAVILLVHPFGLLFYAVLVGALGLGSNFQPLMNPRELGRRIGRAAVACIPIVISLVCLLVIAPRLPGTTTNGRTWDVVWQGRWLLGHVLMMLGPIKTYDLTRDLVFLALLALPLVISAATRRIRFHAGLLLAAVVLMILSNFMPIEVAGTWAIEMRIPCMAALALVVSMRPDIPFGRHWNWLGLAAALLLASTKTLWITHVWIERQADVVSVERALLRVPPGSVILSMDNEPSREDIALAPLGRFFQQGTQPVYWHYPTLAIVERHAFVPTLFTAVGKQPITVLPPWDQIAVSEGILPGVHLIDDPTAAARFPYLKYWRDRFEFLLVVNADMSDRQGPLPSLPELLLIADEGFAKLYQINRGSRDKAAAASNGVR